MSKSDQNGDYAGVGLAMRLALTLAAPLVVAVYLGQYLGSLYGREVLFITVCLLLGLFIGFNQALRLLLKK